MREWNAFKYLEMSIFRNNIISIRDNGTVYKFVIIWI